MIVMVLSIMAINCMLPMVMTAEKNCHDGDQALWFVLRRNMVFGVSLVGLLTPRALRPLAKNVPPRTIEGLHRGLPYINYDHRRGGYRP